MTWWHRLSTALLSCCTQILSRPFQSFLWPPSPSAVQEKLVVLGKPLTGEFLLISARDMSLLAPCMHAVNAPSCPKPTPTRCHHWSFSMGSSCGFHYNYPSEETSRYLTWLKTNHQAKIRNKFPLVTKALSQADCFGMTNFGVLAQIPGSRVVEKTGSWGFPVEGAQKESQINCCQADSKEGARGVQTTPKTCEFLTGPTDPELHPLCLPMLVCEGIWQ